MQFGSLQDFLKMFFRHYEAKTQRMLTHLRVYQQSNDKKQFKKTSLDTACNGSTIKKTLIIHLFLIALVLDIFMIYRI